MTDQIYYQVQYPLKKAINEIKKIELEDNVEKLTEDEKIEIKEFLQHWHLEGKLDLKKLISRLRKVQ